MPIIRERGCFDRTSGVSSFLPCVDVLLTSDALEMKESSLRAGKWISSCSQGIRFSALNVWLVPRLGSVGEAGFKTKLLIS